MNDLGTSLTFGFSLFCNGAYHTFIDIHMFDFNISDLNAPCISMFIQYLLDIRIQPLSNL